MADRPAGEAVRALAWLGKSKANEALQSLQRNLSPDALSDIVRARAQLPTWLAEQVSRTMMNG
jgi:hypothetical protein